jgi:hypothetical protein
MYGPPLRRKRNVRMSQVGLRKCIRPLRGLKQVDFCFEGHELRGLEQNPDTKSKWAAMARDGKKVMEFLDGGRYVAVVVDGKMKTYA